MLNKDLVNIKIAQNINHATNIFNQQKKNGSYGSSPRAYSTIISALQVLFDSNIANRTIKYYIVDGNDKKGGDLGIDAICFNNYDKTIYILDVKEGGSDGFGVSTVRNLLQDVTSRFLNKKNDLEGINSRLRRAFSQGKNLFFKKKWKLNVKIVRLLRVRENNKDTERLCAAFRENNGERVEAKLFGLNDAIDLLIKNKVRKTSYIWMVDFENDGSFRSSTTFEKDSRPSVLIGKLKVKQFLYLMKDFKKKKLDLFEDNVRLDMRNSELSRELIGTLTKYPADFYIYHNGLTISCSLIEPDGDVSYRIHNPSVINGCQSLNAILRGCKDGYVKNKHLKEATILCRIFALNSQKKVEAVCQSTNTQRKINTWDLRANDPIQKLLELILREKNITYYRKIRNIKKNEILITDLAQWIYSCKFEKPADAKNQKSQLFDIREEEDSIYWGKIFRESLLEIDELENICRIGLFVRDKIGNVKGKGNKDKKKFLRYSNFHIMAALYLITRNCGIQAALSDKAYEFAISETNKIVRERVNDDSDKYTFNFLFSKDKNTWLSLKQKIINWKPNG